MFFINPVLTFVRPTASKLDIFKVLRIKVRILEVKAEAKKLEKYKKERIITKTNILLFESDVAHGLSQKERMSL